MRACAHVVRGRTWRRRDLDAIGHAPHGPKFAPRHGDMQTEIVEVMRTQVRAIHRALTGDEPIEQDPVVEAETGEPQETDDDIVRRFLELDAVSRTIPAVAARVPPFSFTPPLDVIAGDDSVILELALPGIARGDVSVEPAPGGLVVSGVRRDEHAAEGRTFHAEIPRGPFRRVIPLPFAVESEPRIELAHGVLRIHLAFSAAQPAAPDRGSTTGGTRR